MGFNVFKKESTPSGLCCLYLLPDQLIVTHLIQNSSGQPTITFIEISICQLQSLKFILESIIKKHGLRQVACTWVLHPSYYQLFLLDPPAVADAEVPLALRWQVKELITFSAENAVIEYFPVPSALDAKKKIYAAAAEKTTLQTVVNIINEAELNLQFIDIPELALRNINALYGDNDCYLGLLTLTEKNNQFIITHEKNVLLSRQLSLPDDITNDTLSILPQSLTPPDWLNAFITEIHRSFTYCQSQQQKDIPLKLLIITTIPALAPYFGSLLGIATEQAQIENKLNFEFVVQPNELTSLNYFIAIGGALRNATN